MPPTPTTALTGFRLSNNSQHVFFIGTDNHVHELDIAGAGWDDHDLTTLAGAVAPTPTTALTGYPLSNNSKHVFFIGTDNHVHELFIAGAGWADNDLDGAHVAGSHCAQDLVDLATVDDRMTQHAEHPCRAHSRSVEGDGKRIQRRLRAP